MTGVQGHTTWNSVVKFCLRAKHWQVFLFTCGLYSFGEVALIQLISMPTHSDPGFARYGLLMGVGSAVLGTGFFVWLWSVGTFLNSIVSPELQMNSALLRIAVITPPLYNCFVGASLVDNHLVLTIFAVLLDVFVIFCIFYSLNFVSKCFTAVELGRSPSFSNYADTFFLLVFFPIGIWVVQPRINHMAKMREKERPIL